MHARQCKQAGSSCGRQQSAAAKLERMRRAATAPKRKHSRLFGVAAGAGVRARLVALTARDQDAHVVWQRLLLGARGARGVRDGQGGLAGSGAACGGRAACGCAAAAGSKHGLQGAAGERWWWWS